MLLVSGPAASASEFHVIGWDGTSIVLPYDPGQTVADLQSALQTTRGIPPRQQLIRHDGDLLDAATTLADAGVSAEDHLSLHARPMRFTGVGQVVRNSVAYLEFEADHLKGDIPTRLEASESLAGETPWEPVASVYDADWQHLDNPWTGEWGAAVFRAARDPGAPRRFFRLAAPDTAGTWLARSHAITPTRPGIAPDFRQLSVVEAADGAYWVATCELGDTLFLMKCDPWGRTLIPPFAVSEMFGHQDINEDYYFTLSPLEDGGLQILSAEEDPRVSSSLGRNGLKRYRFSADGICTEQRFLMHFEGDNAFKDLWSARTTDGRTVFVAKQPSYSNVMDHRLVYGVVDEDGALELFVIRAEQFYHDQSYAYAQPILLRDANRLLLYIRHEHEPSGKRYALERWDLHGNLERSVDLTAYLDGYLARLPRILKTDNSLIMTMPSQFDAYHPALRLLRFDPVSLAVLADTMVDIPLDPTLGYARYALNDTGDDVFAVAWCGSPIGHVYCARIGIDGTVVSPPGEILDSGILSDPRNVRLFVHDGTTTAFYQYDAGGSTDWQLAVRHVGLDFQAGLPDLVLSMDMVGQSPYYALLDSEVALRVRVANQGEAAADPATLRLTEGGNTREQSVPALAPGESATFQFVVDTPAFLTEPPGYTVEVLGDAGWDFNNTISRLFRYPPATPVYPEGSALYMWTVQDLVTHEPIQWARYNVTIPDVKTLDGETRDVSLSDWTDTAGGCTTVLPAGTYTFRVSRTGYPTTEFVKTVPGPASSLFELEPPGDLAATFTDAASGEPLNPAPATTRIELAGHPGGYTAEGRGDLDGLELADIMPGDYSASISAVGYEDASASIAITGGQTNSYAFDLNPLPRATLAGTALDDGDSLPLDGAVARIAGISSLQCTTGADGTIEIANLPYGEHTLVVERDDYLTGILSIQVDDPAIDVGEIRLIPIVSSEMNLGAWTSVPFNEIAEFPGTFFSPGYKVTATYGAFEGTATLLLDEVGDAADLDKLRLHLDGLAWCSYGVSTPFSLTDLICSPLDDVADGAGDLCATLTDQAIGEDSFFDCLELDVGLGGNMGQTMVRVDRVLVTEGGSVVHDTGFAPRYSEDSPLTYPIGQYVADLSEVNIRVWVRVTDTNYNTGPLFLCDTLRYEWKWDGGALKFQTPIVHPADYPQPPR